VALSSSRAWLLFVAALAGLWLQRDAGWLRMALLAPPPLFTGLIAWLFARSLRAPRVPVIARIVAGLQRCDPAELEPPLQRYTRRLTAAWALVLALLTLATITLALVAVPDGVLVRLGHPPVIEVSRQAWSWFANLCDYGIVGGFFVAEYALRRRWFPDQPYRNFADFLRQMGALGPQFWRRLFD